MVLKNWYSIFIVLLLALPTIGQQVDGVKCLNALFQEEVDAYLSYDVPIITVADAYAHQSDYLFLDARALEEYNTSHIRSAVRVGYDDFDFNNVKHVAKDQPIIIYCSIGYRSEKIGKKLQDAGYENVYNLYGSIFEWTNQHHPIYAPNGEPTSQIHTYNEAWSRWVSNDQSHKVW